MQYWTITDDEVQSCGEDLYDDFVENRPGAAGELEAYLNKVPQSSVYSPGNSHPTSAVSSVFSPAGGPSPLSPTSDWSSPGSASPYKHAWQDPSARPQQTANVRSYAANLGSYVDPLWLYTCVNEGKRSTKMRHLDINMSKINSDRDLALALGNLYSQINKRWSRFLKLRGLLSIRFVQVS